MTSLPPKRRRRGLCVEPGIQNIFQAPSGAASSGAAQWLRLFGYQLPAPSEVAEAVSQTFE